MYSQNDEEKYILDYFGDKTGRFYDIGAWTGKKFSNTRALLERGWSGVMVEPEPRSFAALIENTKEFGERVRLVNAAISTTSTLLPFWSGNGDAVSTLSETHRDKWNAAVGGMGRYWVKTVTPDELFAAFGPVEFISLDTEGTNFEIFQRIPLQWPELRMVCVEHDGRIASMCERAEQLGFRQLAHNAENLMLVR